MSISNPNTFLSSLFESAVQAAQPNHVIESFLPQRPIGRTLVVGAGKASAQMGRAFEQAWMEKHGEPVEGVIITRYGYGCQCQHLEVLEAAHPVPDEAGMIGAQRLLDAVSDLSGDDLVVALISGGGSALLPCPPEGLTLEDEIAVNEVLLASGAPISDMNTVRKHVSRIKGGRLAAAAQPAKVVSLLVSDIPGDYPEFIASGPTVPDHASRNDALSIIDHYRMKLPDTVMAHLASHAADAPKPDDQAFANATHHIVASAGKSLEAARSLAISKGIETHILSDAIEGEAREVAKMHAAIAREILHQNRPFKKPCLLLSGGETSVTLKGMGGGKGGRNTEFLLSFALEIAGCSGIHALSADTDGIDGSEDNAGAFVDHMTCSGMRAAGVDPKTHLLNNDAWTAFDNIGALFMSGPTGTNVNDFRAILIGV